MKKIFVIIISIMCFTIFCGISKEAHIKYVLASMIYGTSNSSSNIIFSKESGFYDKEFELSVFAPTKEIYYTIDGGDPDKTSLKYEGPIRIYDATNNPNVYSVCTDVTTRFSEEIQEEYINWEKSPTYKIPAYEVDKCNVIKVVYYDEEDNRSEIEEKVYFVGFDNKTGYEDVNVICITTDPNNLFDYENGIYVTGQYFDTYKEMGIPERKLRYWEHWDANYRQRGKEWERESNIQIFNKEKEHVYSQNVGIRIQGGGSRGYFPKSINIYAREEYGNNRLEYDFWGTGYEPKRMTLSSCGNDYYTKIKDRLISELSDECNIVTMNYEPYVLFLNGEYWGFYYLTEKYDAQYIEHYYGVDKGNQIDDIIMIKNEQVEIGEVSDYYVSYAEMQAFILNNDIGYDDNFQKACELIDIQSFIDYFAIEGYIARCGDWPESNFALWRSRNISGKPYEDGKWRWMLFDVNSSSLGTSFLEDDFIAIMRADSPLFDSMCESEIFKKMFADRVLELSNTIFAEENVNKKIDEYIQLMDEPMEKHYQRFFGTSNEKFYSVIDDIRSFFDSRKEYVIESIKNNFGEEYLQGEYQ